MAAVELGAAEAEALLARYKGRVSVAADNGQQASVVSGEREAVTEVVAELERQGVMVRELRSSGVGGHSEQVAGVSAALPQVLAGVQGRRSEVALISTVTGQEVSGETVDGDYWARNVRERVRFREGMETLARRGEAVYVEMNAHPVLGLWVREAVAAERGNAGVVVGALRRERGEREVTLAGLAEVYAAGVDVNWETVWRGGGARYVQLPSYPWQRQRFWIERPEPEQRPQIFSEAELSDNPRLKKVVETIVEKWGRDGALAVNRRYLAPFGFIGTKQESLFYFNLRGTSIVALLYVGPDNQYEPLVQELLKYAEEHGYQLNLIATESGIGVLQGLNFSTTPCGSFQSISDLSSFTLHGNKMRRLRYQVDHYKRQGKCVTREYKAGSISSTDREIVALIDEWVTFKKKKVPFANDLKQDIARGTLDPRLRLFLTYSDETLDSVVLISPAFASGGYLMDLEFYREATRSGCLEFAITEIIRQLADEGHSYFSLGGSFGTQLNSHPNANPEVERLFVTLRQEEVLNGDGNFQFKNKFRPETSSLYLCHPKRYDASSLSDVLLTLAGEGADAVSDGPARSFPVNGTSKSRPSPAAINSPRRQLHPLLGEKLQLAMRDVIFQSQQTINSLPFLQDHKIGGTAVLPGTAYIEMGLAAAKAIFGPGPHSLLDLSLQQAMIFSDAGAQTIQLVMKSENDGVASFQILSTPSDELKDAPPWSLHATGPLRVASPSGSVEQQPSIEDIRTRCAEEITGEQYYGLLEQYGFEYGEAFQGVTHVWRRDGEAIAQVQIPESLSAEVGNYRIHPALLDACLQVFEATIKTERNGQSDVYLLRGAEEISLYVDQPKRVWSHVVLHETGGTTSGLFTGDLKLYDDSGQTVAEVKRIYAKRASTDFLLRNTQQRLSDWLYEIEWRPLSREPQPETSSCTQRSWLILSDRNGLGEKLQAQLKSKGQHCVIVYAGQKYEVNGDQIYINPTNPDDFCRLLEEVSAVLAPGPIGLVNLWSIDSAPQNETVQGIAESVRTSCGGVLYLTQALIEKGPQDLRLWVVTRGAQAVDKEPYSHKALGQSPLWGLGRVISVEHPEIWGGLIDLDPAEAAIVSEQLSEELLRPIEGETQIAYRNGHRYVARLTHSSQSQLNSARLDFKSGSTYLVTGGLGGLGLECARWMAEHGAKHIALVSRRDADDELREKISHIEKTGSQVRVFAADVTDETQVGQVIAEIRESMPPLRGVVNAAGVLDDGMVHTQTWDQFQRVLDPKVKGSYLLHQHTSAMQLDFFVLFSSAASMFGSAGQANHAAANAFLDALAHYRRGLGRPALSVNWGAWSEIGEAAARNVGERLSAKGIEPIEPEQGWRALEMIFNHSSAQVGVIPIDWKKWKQLYLGANTPPLMAELMQEPASPFTNRAVSRNPKLKEEFSATAPDERPAFVEAYLARETARVLRMDVGKLALQQPLSELGIDSIMTVELRDVIDVDWQVKVPLVEFFREPTIERLASIVLGQLAPTSTPTPTDPAALLAQLDKMSETDVDNLLGVMLAKQDEALPEPQTATF
jgi:acyl transferase domain-containing protein/acyl carrier protein